MHPPSSRSALARHGRFPPSPQSRSPYFQPRSQSSRIQNADTHTHHQRRGRSPFFVYPEESRETNPPSLSRPPLPKSIDPDTNANRRGMASSSTLLKVLAANFDVLAGPLVTLVYPLYASVRAIETKSPVDDQQWLTYWVLYSLITLFELTFAKVIEWIPLWSYMKLLMTCWLVLPYFSGAAYVYQHFVRPFFVNSQTVNICYVPGKKEISSQPEDLLRAAEKYIQENGPEAFEKLIIKAEKAAKSANNSSMMFDVEAKRGSVLSGNYYDRSYPIFDDYNDYRY